MLAADRAEILELAAAAFPELGNPGASSPISTSRVWPPLSRNACMRRRAAGLGKRLAEQLVFDA